MDQSTRLMTSRWIARLALALFAGVSIWSSALMATSGCDACHTGGGVPHGAAPIACDTCHGGDPAAVTADTAHAGMRVRPGELDNASASCGGCHPAQFAGVDASLMHTGAGMVAVTRALLDADNRTSTGPPRLDALGEGVADSLLRRLCASCHLGQPRSGVPQDAVSARGGGCLACHLHVDPAGGHPRLSLAVGDQACFGCHSRSGRIALNYVGLAEVDPPVTADGWRGLARLSDGRLVEHRQDDVHHRAGMGCVDCHTGPGLMGLTDGIDIACTDCHDNHRPRLRVRTWPESQRAMLRRVPFAATPDQAFLQTARGTPLWHIELRGDEVWLHPKSGAAPLRVSQAGVDHAPEAAAHRALSCDACHATWAPQCYGCHVSFDPADSQWDHVAHREVPGAWHEQRWGIRNALPPLGRAADGTVIPVVPGMIATVVHPDLGEARFIRRFAGLAPHTTGKARACDSCHGAPAALGLGAGDLVVGDDGVNFVPATPRLQDGLPADAWTDMTGRVPATRLSTDPRPFAAAALQRLLRPLP